jgi:L,D-transpeptidase catalytic domain
MTGMKSYSVDSIFKRTGARPARFALAGLAVLTAVSVQASAASSRNEQSIESRSAGEPIMAIVSLHDQLITVYDAKGQILRAPVSSGQKGRETPAGIFTVLQKDAEHYSNMYDDAYMPHMQRLTWSGIALHGGPLPGYPASHGCIRMPYDFAGRLFDATKLGMRVVVAPSGAVPRAINHPALFQPKSGPGAAAVAAAAAEANKAASTADQARIAAMTISRESATGTIAVRKIEIQKLKAEAQLAAADRMLAAAASAEAKEQAEDAKTRAQTQVDDLAAQLASAKAALQPKLDAAQAAREAASAAENARVAAAETARKLARELEPVSIFISRKSQRLYMRQALQPVLDIPITIQDADRPIGTHVFTAMERTGAEMQWTVVSLHDRMPNSGDEPNGVLRKGRSGDREAAASESINAKAALDRITIPPEVVDRIAETLSPRSSLIISDEALSPETGNGTEFVVILSDEPQGGLKHRRREPQMYVRYDRSPYWRGPMAGSFSPWWR